MLATKAILVLLTGLAGLATTLPHPDESYASCRAGGVSDEICAQNAQIDQDAPSRDAQIPGHSIATATHAVIPSSTTKITMTTTTPPVAVVSALVAAAAALEAAKEKSVASRVSAMLESFTQGSPGKTVGSSFPPNYSPPPSWGGAGGKVRRRHDEPAAAPYYPLGNATTPAMATGTAVSASVYGGAYATRGPY